MINWSRGHLALKFQLFAIAVVGRQAFSGVGEITVKKLLIGCLTSGCRLGFFGLYFTALLSP